MGRNILKILSVAALMALPTSAIAGDGNSVTPNVSRAEVINAMSGNTEGVSRLFRDKRGVSVEIVSSGLDQDAVYTVWWILFNEPEACATTPCTEPDLRNPAVNGGVFWADGFHASSAGIGSLTATLLENDVSGEFAPFAPNTLQNAAKAEIHMVLKSHGPADLNKIFAQVTSSEGGPNCLDCADTHFAIHLAD